jgi:predicted ATPase
MGQACDAVQMMVSGLTAYQQTGSTIYLPFWSSILAKAYADLDQFDDAWCCVGEAMTAIETTVETISEAEVNRVAGELALNMPERDASKAEAYFERALDVAHQQQATSWELRAAMSLARLWRDAGSQTG